MIELSRTTNIVQPIYIYGDNRKSEKLEIKAMKRILAELKKHKNTVANILPIKFVDKKVIPPNAEITGAYNIIRKQTNLGTQHEWLARYAYINPGLEIGTELAPLEVSNILTAINNYAKVKWDENKLVYIIDSKKSSKEGRLIFGNLHFPIINKTGKDMKDNIIKWGYEDIIKHVWVCHTPLFKKPCGLCHPCELKIETGMSFVLSNKAIKRYKNKDNPFYKFYYKILRKINNIIY